MLVRGMIGCGFSYHMANMDVVSHPASLLASPNQSVIADKYI